VIQNGWPMALTTQRAAIVITVESPALETVAEITFKSLEHALYS